MKTVDNEARPAYCYIARRQPCGCVMGVASDYGDRTTARMVADWIAGGYAVERVSDADFHARVKREPGFFKRPHRANPPAGQLALTAQEEV